MHAMRTLGFADFTEFATAAMAGCRPYPYQQRLATEPLPELLRVPTGAGKTAAAVLPWLWRRLTFPAADPQSTYDRLVYVLPLRSLAEQTQRQVTAWLERLGLAGTIAVVRLGGGETGDDDWRLYPHQPAILIGTQDMVLSRLLMRGYGEWRALWPVTFGLLHSSVQFVFDECQLLGPALRTSLRLQALRDSLGVVGGSATMWMSATARTADIAADHPGPVRVVELTAADRADEHLARRLEAVRVVRRAALPSTPQRYPAALAAALAGWHVPGTATMAIVNDLGRAMAVYDALEQAAPAADRMLLHACFRPHDLSITAARLDTPIPPDGRIVVTTQAVEAGIDISCRTMFTESAPWSAIVQRAGRCNRDGRERDAVLWWAPPPAGGPDEPAGPAGPTDEPAGPAGPAPPGGLVRPDGRARPGRAAAGPYDVSSLMAAQGALGSLAGVAVTTTALQDVRVAQARGGRAGHPLLRRSDLLALFDTAPAAVGPDIDVTPWLRDGDDETALVAWRAWLTGAPALDDEPAPGRDEVCPGPLTALRHAAGRYWICDQVDGRWRRCEPADIRPGVVLLADAAAGGYLPDQGWAPRSVTPVAAAMTRPGAGPDVIDRDPRTFTGAWVDLRTHLADTERELRALTGGHRCTGLGAEQLEAAALAARFHDIGKAFGYFQDYLRGSVPQPPPGRGPWAKSPGRGGPHTARPHLRHELVTTLALLDPRCRLLDGVAEPDLVVYLAAAHHGKVRLSVRSLPGESGQEPPRLLGVQDGDEFPPVALWDGAQVPPLTLDTTLLDAGPDPAPGERASGGGGAASWAARTAALRDRADLGPFRLAYLEALVRVADWRASRDPSVRSAVPPSGPAGHLGAAGAPSPAA
jgi:CRISPR-associated endonuclease/helicase Cas3